MAIAKLGPALAAGCTMVLKPAEETPLTTLRLGELILEAGFPPGVVNVITGYGHVVGAAIAAHPGIDKVAFTGSTETGKKIIRAATGNLKKVSMELGGKSPVVIFDDADIDRAVAGAAHMILLNCGQMCFAGSRLLVHENVYDEVVEGVADIARNTKIGPGIDPETELRPAGVRQATGAGMRVHRVRPGRWCASPAGRQAMRRQGLFHGTHYPDRHGTATCGWCRRRYSARCW